jgi:hypothetical protein
MRIKSFSEARGIFESEEFSLEPHIYCFGGGGGGGNGGSSSDSDVDAMGAAAAGADYGGSMSGSGANTAGAGAGMHDGGGDGGNDSDRGGGSDNNQQDRQAYSDRFGGVSTRNFNVDKDQGFVDTDKGRVYGASDVLGKGIAKGDITPTDRQATAIDMASQITGIDPSNIAVGGDLFFGEEDLMANQDLLGSMADFDVPEFDEPGGAVSMYGIPGVTPPGTYTPTSITESVTARGPGLSYDPGLDYESQAYNVSRTPSTTLGPDGALGIAAARDNFRARGLDITGNIDPVTGQPVPGSGTGTRDVSTTIDPMDMLDPFGDGFMTDEQRAASDAEIAATNARIDALRGASPAEQITAQARQPVDMSPQQGRVVSETVLGEPGTLALGPKDMQIVSDILDEAVPGRVSTGARTEPVFGGDLFMDEAVPVSRGTPTSVDVPGYQATNYTEADLAKAQQDFETAKAEAYREKQFGLDTGLPSSIDVFGAKVPTGVGVFEGIADALFQPDAALANAIAERGIKSLDGASAQGAANYNPNGLEVVTSGGPLSEGGRTVAYDAKGNIVYDSRGIGSQIGDFLTGNRPPENIQDLYDRQRAIDEQQREMSGGDGGQTTTAPAQEVVPEPPPEDYQGRDMVSDYQYQPRGPINYAYTGLPSLAPQVLRPSYQARGQYAPLFPMGNYRRS